MEQVILDHLGETSSLFGLYPNFVFDSNILISNKSKYEQTDRYYRTEIDEKLEGKCFSLYPNGQINEEGKFIDDKKEGIWTSWYSNGHKLEEGKYLDDMKNGKWTSWYDNGQKYEEGKYLDDMKSGLWISWWRNGEIKDDGEYIDDDGFLYTP